MSDELRQRPGDQPLPRTADPTAPGAHDKAIKLLEERRALGLRRYGATLQPFNGRDTRRDLEEEEADRFAYLMTYLDEQDQRIADAERRGAVKALRAEVEYFIGASKSAVLDESTRRTADGAAAHLRSMADRIESGDLDP